MSSIPVNFDNVRYSPVDRRPYFWDPAYPQWIQFLENGAWASRHVSRAKEETKDENIKKIAKKAERLLPPNLSATETPGPAQRPTLPSFQSYHAKISSEPPCHGPAGKRRTPQRRLLPASTSGSSVSARKHPYSQVPRGQTQPSQGTTDGPYPRLDYYCM
ncbi:hypothetical protein AG0111_0g11693 [Alternaria gaisen]|uniref:Uncharacterized protein n=1 Tax=Alternaria gaisen TaxID=167740 RepID=A0ACB6F6J1_9PLEO|nr:hypothetical protein AG0111_0g11693 [Alternaria gaisen]